MWDRQRIQKEMVDKLAEGQATLEELKARLKQAGRDTSGEIERSVAEAERTLEKGRARLRKLAAASDGEFEGLWRDTRETWHAVSRDIDNGWHRLSAHVKNLLG